MPSTSAAFTQCYSSWRTLHPTYVVYWYVLSRPNQPLSLPCFWGGHHPSPIMPGSSTQVASLRSAETHGHFIPHLPFKAHGAVKHEAACAHHQHAWTVEKEFLFIDMLQRQVWDAKGIKIHWKIEILPCICWNHTTGLGSYSGASYWTYYIPKVKPLKAAK